MLKHIPRHFRGTDLVELLNAQGFNAQYDFVYLPICYQRKTPIGYAFVNMIDHDKAANFIKRFDGLDNGTEHSADPKVPTAYEVRWGLHHCKSKHVERYRNSPLMHPKVPDDYKPMVFEHGKKVDFPKSTRPVQFPSKLQSESSSSNTP